MTPRTPELGACEACDGPVSPLCGQLGIARRLCAEHLTEHLEQEHRARVEAGLVPMSDELSGAARTLEEFARSMRRREVSTDASEPLEP